MIAYKGRESKRGKAIRMPRNIERLFKEGKCRECSVVVTRMDFAKILGKFTKVKIQYETNSTPKTPKVAETATPNSNARLKSNENGMVLLHRNAYNQHPAKELNNSVSKKLKKQESTTRQVSNVLKENNGPNKADIFKDSLVNHDDSFLYNKINKQNSKQYAIIFSDPSSNNNYDHHCNFSLLELLPNVNKSILPSEEWCIDFFPKTEEPTDDKVYDRIAAELEDLMYNDKSDDKLIKAETTESKVDDFPSIMDILNDNTAPVNNSDLKDQSSSVEFKDNLESSDVEAMLLGNQTVSDDKVKNEKLEPSPMEVDNNDVNKLIEDVVQFNSINEEDKPQICDTNDMDNPHSPSILDEALQKGIEEHLPSVQPLKEEMDISSVLENNTNNNSTVENDTKPEHNITTENNTNENININDANDDQIDENTSKNLQNGLNLPPTTKLEDVTHIIFKKVIDGVCKKAVTCPKTLKYSIELDGKSVEFLGAPKYISSFEDLQVLLQIVNESDLQSLHVLH